MKTDAFTNPDGAASGRIDLSTLVRCSFKPDDSDVTYIIPIEEISVEGNLRVAEHEFPHVPGSEPEKLARKAYVIHVEANFSGVLLGSGDDVYGPNTVGADGAASWPDVLNDLARVFDEGRSGNFTAPNLPQQIRAYCRNWTRKLKSSVISGERVTVTDKKLCPRYQAVKMSGIKVGPSPWWLKRRLLSAGLRPVNNVVDITNFVMLELGHPIHAFDAEKLAGEAIEVRRARVGESLAALDGKTYTFDDTTLVIADVEKPVAVAGIMGGEHSGVTGATTSLVFEAATFDPVSVRRSARKLNLYSDAQLRFEKGLSTEAPPLALARAVELCLELAGGAVASAVVDVSAGKYKPQQFSVETAEVNALIGVDLPVKEMKDTLTRLGFKVGGTSKKITAVVPWWRDHDIESGRDLVEEMARVYGYANIPAVVPVGIATQPVDAELVWEDRVRTLAKGAGYTETYSYSFVSKELLEQAGYSAAHALRIQNPLSADFEFMRPSLLPSLIQTIVENQERFRAQRLFEVAHVYVHPTDAAPTAWKTLPVEALHLGAARLGGEQAWREAKGFVEHLLAELGIQGVTWTALKDEMFWHPGRSVQAFQGEHLLATVGELHPAIAEAFKLEGRLALVSMPLAEVFGHATATKAYVPLPVFPEAKRDLAVVVDREVEVSILAREMREAHPLVKQVEWFDTYVGKGLADGKKSVAFHLVFATPERTLSSEEVDAAMERIEHVLKQRVGAEVRR
jgi:phenylalanyl-tRNA synthetase beta chain